MPIVRSTPLRLAGLAVALVGALAARPAAAQVNPIRLGISGGAAVPLGDFADGVNSGYTIGGFITVRPPLSPVGFRGEVGYTSFGEKNRDNADQNILSGVANVVLNLSPAGGLSPIRPYLIGGVGAYRQSRDVQVTGSTNIRTESDTRLGLNGGLGLDIPLTGLGVFVEARYTSIFNGDNRDNTNFIPITVGIRF